MRTLYVVLLAVSAIGAAAIVSLVLLPAHVLYTSEKDDYARAMVSVAYCDTTDVTTMPASHRQEHYKVCSDSRDILRRKPTLEAAFAFVVTDYSTRMVSGLATWKFVLFASVVFVALVVGAIAMFDRYVTRKHRRANKGDLYGD